jgi:hypothetical protein
MDQVLAFIEKPSDMICVSLGQYTIIFQAEIYAIGVCVQENLR